MKSFHQEKNLQMTPEKISQLGVLEHHEKESIFLAT